jgi:haloalkane dehalogenase
MNRSRTNGESISEHDVAQAIARGPTRWLEIGGGHIAHYRFGRGPDVLFVHGWPLHAATFRRIVPTLAAEFTCHLVDLPGAGRSVAGPGAPIDLSAHATTLRGVAGALELGDYAVLAHDSGGLAARHLAVEDSRVRGLVLGGTEIPRHTPWLIAMFVLLARTPFGASVARKVLGTPLLLRSALGFGGCFTDARYANGEFADLFVRPLLESREAMENAFELLRGLDSAIVERLSEVHHRITAPTDLIWGARDPFFPIAKARRMVSEFGGRATLHELADAKLFAHEDHAEAFAAIAKRALGSYFSSADAVSVAALAS